MHDIDWNEPENSVWLSQQASLTVGDPIWDDFAATYQPLTVATQAENPGDHDQARGQVSSYSAATYDHQYSHSSQSPSTLYPGFFIYPLDSNVSSPSVAYSPDLSLFSISTPGSPL